jgi:transposase, IS5 family
LLTIAYPRPADFLAGVPFDCEIDPKLVGMDEVLDDPKVVLAVTHDLARSAPEARWNGRPSTPVEVTLRVAVARRLMNWGYRAAESEVAGSAKWRWFCRVYSQPVPDHTTLRDREALIRPATLKRVNAQLLKLAQDRGVTRGEKLRMDGTVMETDIHYPTDSRLLDDSVRVLGRSLARARMLLQPSQRDKPLFRNRQRQAHRLARAIAQQLRGTKGQNTPKKKAERLYRQLVAVTETTIAQVEAVLARLQAKAGRPAQALLASLQHYLPLVRRVIAQTRRRVFDGQSVPAAKKLVSLFEPHTAVIRRGKTPPRDTEFGRKIWYSEVDGGLISDYRLLRGNPPDEQQWAASIEQHQKLFGHPPKLATADRGVFSTANEQMAQEAGIECVALPQPGHKDAARQAHEAQPWFRAALRFRAGIEGRISHLRRARKLDRCRHRGEVGLARWLGWGVVANNLAVIAAHLAGCRRKQLCHT